jgi:hypothetical protein
VIENEFDLRSTAAPDLAVPAVGTAGRTGVARERTHPRRMKRRQARGGFMGVVGSSQCAGTGGSDVQVDGLLG